MRQYPGLKSASLSLLLGGLTLGATGCGSSQPAGDTAKAAEVRQATRDKWEQAKADGTASQVKGQSAPADTSGSGRSRYMQKH